MDKLETSGSSKRKRRLGELGKQRRIKLRIYDSINADNHTITHYLSCEKSVMDDQNRTYMQNMSTGKQHLDTVQNQPKIHTVSTKSMEYDVCKSMETVSKLNGKPTTTNKNDKLERNDSGYSSDNMDEDDVFETVDISVKKQAGPPDSVDNTCSWARYSDSSPVETRLFKFGPSENRSMFEKIVHRFQKTVKTRPDDWNDIYIQHKNATDSELGDRFGARLETYTESVKEGHAIYHQHFLCKVQSGEPANLMKIKDWDEIVLINNEFIPNLTHTEVLNIFGSVKVDGKTRFSLVIRRIEEPRNVHKKQWQWYETSSILVAGSAVHVPEVTDPHYHALENNQMKLKRRYRFNAKGTQYFLDINPIGISVDVLHDSDADVTKDITECDIYRENPKTEELEYVSSLCGHDDKSFLSVDMTNTIVVSEKETWFKLRMLGSSVSFQLQENCAYIAVDESRRTLTSQTQEYYFNRVPLPDDQDFTDEGIEQCQRSKQSTKSSSSYHSSISQMSQSSSPAFEPLKHDSLNSLGIKIGSLIHPALNGNGMVMNSNTNSTDAGRITRSMSRQMSTTRNDFDMLEI